MNINSPFSGDSEVSDTSRTMHHGAGGGARPSDHGGANRFKEYKAYVPPEWQAFDDVHNNVRINPRTKFSHMLRGGGADATTRTQKDAGDASYETKLRTGPKCAQWAQEMAVYVKKKKLREEAALRTKALQEDLHRKQEAALNAKAKALEVPVVDGASMCTNYHQARQKHPEHAHLYQMLLSRAEASKVVAKWRQGERRQQEKIDKLTKQGEEHDQHMRTRLAEVRRERHQHTMEKKAQLDRSLLVSEQNRFYAQCDKEDKTLQAHREAEAREAEYARKREQKALEEQERRKQERLETERKVQGSFDRLRSEQRAWENNIKQRMGVADERMEQRRVDLELKREEHVALGMSERAKHAREEQRSAQLERLKTLDEQREERIRAKKAADRQAQKEYKAKLAQEEARAAQNLNGVYHERKAKIEHHLTSYRHDYDKAAPMEGSEVARRVEEAQELYDLHQRELQQRRDFAEVQQRQRDELVEARLQQQRDENHRRAVEKEHHRVEVMRTANHLLETSEAQTQQAVTESMQRADERRAALEKARKHEAEQIRQRNTSKTVACLDKVNANDIFAAINKMEENQATTEARRLKSEAELTAARRAKSQSRAAHVAKMRRQVEGKQREKEHQSEQRLQRLSEQAERAFEAREESLMARQAMLQQAADETARKVEDALRKKEERIDGKRRQLEANDSRRQANAFHAQKDRAVHFKHKAREGAQHRDTVRQQHDAARVDTVRRFMEHNDRVKQQQQQAEAMSPARRPHSDAAFYSPQRHEPRAASSFQ